MFLLLIGSLSVSAQAETEPAALPEMEGKVVLLNFWATWCRPCVAELPLLDALHDRLEQEEAIVLAVNVDRHDARARAFLRHKLLDLPVVYDPRGEIARDFAPGAMPTSFLVDATGAVVAHYEGAIDEATLGAIEGRMRSLLPAPQ